ncbi:MAG TPA: hypothetical protein VGE04_07910 [Chloroflexia bacterium]
MAKSRGGLYIEKAAMWRDGGERAGEEWTWGSRVEILVPGLAGRRDIPGMAREEGGGGCGLRLAVGAYLAFLLRDKAGGRSRATGENGESRPRTVRAV